MTRIRFALLVLALAWIPSMVHAQPLRGRGAWFHPLQIPVNGLAEQAQAIPQEKKDHVHFFLVNGFDPAYSANLNGVAAYCRSIGFSNTTCLQLAGAGKLKRQILTIRAADPDARVILLGFSWGANIVRSLANRWERDGIMIDSMVYLGGDTVSNSPSSRPGNVRRILNITANGFLLSGGNLIFKGADIDGARNHRINVPHLALPSNREAIRLVGEELIAQATLPGNAPPAGATAEPPALTPPPPTVTVGRAGETPAVPAMPVDVRGATPDRRTAPLRIP
jgi:pimeloyl-ACP methyl ester carboxylesterase